ncbi:aspartic-type endopeptidase activity [Nesidiocoris tenuis]|uniref:Aspartic-type endopeptidase activity n=1 Tax=Nesidiocoris tenuis TaxID=355587 RepID=A0ABN7AF11_9HEMI|nr:aspartic-type endopeptidase activity [Nesidiocoris tenuis]
MISTIVVLLACAFVGPAMTEKIISTDLVHTDSPFITLLKQGIHPSMIESMMSAQVGDNVPIPVPLMRFLDNDFFGETLFGHPGQSLFTAFDTIWVDSWVPTTTCSAISPACALRRKYDPTRSPFSISLNKAWETPIGKETLKGSLYNDLLHVNQVNITNHTFAAVSEIPWVYVFNKFDGILGLNVLVNGNMPSILTSLRQQNHIDKTVMSFYFNRNPDSKKGGTLVFGGVEKRHYRGNFTFVNLVPGALDWMIRVNQITVTTPSQKKMILCKGGCNAIMMSNGNPIGGPALEIDDLNKAIGAQKWFGSKYTVNCAKIQNLPKVSFTIGDRAFVLSGKDYIQRVALGSLGTICFSSFQPNFESNSTTWYIGGAFMSRYYTTLDADAKRIGFADANL